MDNLLFWRGAIKNDEVTGSMHTIITEGAQGKLSRTPTSPPPPATPTRPEKQIVQDFLFFFFVSLLGGSFLGCAPVDGLLLFLALTKEASQASQHCKSKGCQTVL